MNEWTYAKVLAINIAPFRAALCYLSYEELHQQVVRCRHSIDPHSNNTCSLRGSINGLTIVEPGWRHFPLVWIASVVCGKGPPWRSEKSSLQAETGRYYRTGRSCWAGAERDPWRCSSWSPSQSDFVEDYFYQTILAKAFAPGMWRASIWTAFWNRRDQRLVTTLDSLLSSYLIAEILTADQESTKSSESKQVHHYDHRHLRYSFYCLLHDRSVGRWQSRPCQASHRVWGGNGGGVGRKCCNEQYLCWRISINFEQWRPWTSSSRSILQSGFPPGYT